MGTGSMLYTLDLYHGRVLVNAIVGTADVYLSPENGAAGRAGMNEVGIGPVRTDLYHLLT